MPRSTDIVSAFDSEDIFYKVSTWPTWAQVAFQKPHKDRNERFYLFVFLWKNGLEAWKAKEWMMWHRTYDRSAWQSMSDLEAMTRVKGGRLYLQRFPVMDMALGRVERQTDLNE